MDKEKKLTPDEIQDESLEAAAGGAQNETDALFFSATEQPSAQTMARNLNGEESEQLY